MWTMPRAGCRLASGRATERDRLSGHHGRRVAVQLGVLVHDPRHHLRIGAGVGRGDVPQSARASPAILSTNSRVISCSSVSVRSAGRTVDSSLGAAERDASERGFPRHQRRQRSNLIEIDAFVVADAAFERPARFVVLHPIAREHVDTHITQPHGDLHLDLPVRGPDHRAQVLGDAEAVGRDVEVVRDGVEARRLGRTGMRGAVGNPRRLVGMRQPADRDRHVMRLSQDRFRAWQ